MGNKTMIFEECGCCEHYHLEDFYGDCRDDKNRFTLEEAEKKGMDETGHLPTIITLEDLEYYR